MFNLSRRQFLLAGSAAMMLSEALPFAVATPNRPTLFRYSLNFGTLRGFKLSIEEEIDLAAKAGYDAIEPWVQELDNYQKNGGKLSDLRKRIKDHGLDVAGGIAFFPWSVDDDNIRTQGIEQMKREMEWCREIGGNRIAAAAAGATNQRLDNFKILGQRYRTILEIGEQQEVLPQLEIWGKSLTLGCLADAVAVAVHSGHPKAELLLDIFHLYRGGSSFEALSLLNGQRLTNFHVNDYPADPPREHAEDKDRVYPGDGVAPVKQILRTLREIGFAGFLSLELFNPAYWATQNPLLVAKTGLEKMKSAAIE
ncbi:MAG: sugar phosphate isomerase/epimerase [Planctomycetaceae bacterium]|jgi:sugar phosphate isomerase/epimerase|nr:sugar phosphate isomerase/epimerase [Planctomycetaceae bacterium]